MTAPAATQAPAACGLPIHQLGQYMDRVEQLLDGQATTPGAGLFEDLYHVSTLYGATPLDAARAITDLLGEPLGTTIATRYEQWVTHLPGPGCTCALGWVSHSELGPHPAPDCPHTRQEATDA